MRIFPFFVAVIIALSFKVNALPPVIGPYNVSSASYKVPVIDSTDPSIWLFYPLCNTSSSSSTCKFPLISYLHGMAGGDIDLLGYALFFEQIASYGFIIAAPDSCDVGCTNPNKGAPYTDCAGLPPLQPDHWAPWYGEAFKAIEWARNMTNGGSTDPIFSQINWEAGVGIGGHSMGGQASTLASSSACVQQYDIRASVLHHPANGQLPYGNIGVNISIPTAAFTSSGDSIWPETSAIINALKSTNPTFPIAYRDVTGWSHLEPVLIPPIENPLLATFTAAWFKIFLENDKGYWLDLVFGNGPDSLCKYANMTECYTLNSPI